MSMAKEFKAFIMRGNVVDLAVGVVIGAAFSKIVTSFVSDLLMPPIGLLLGGMDFSKMAIVLAEGHGDVPGVAVRYGAFINTLIDFLIIAAAIFVVVKIVNRMTQPRHVEEAAPTTKECPQCCSTIAVRAKKCPNCCSNL